MKTKTHILNVFQKLNLFLKINVVFMLERENLRTLKEIVLLENHVQEVRLQDKLGKQNYHIKTENLFEHVTDTMKNSAEKLTKALTESSIMNDKDFNFLNIIFSEKNFDTGILASQLLTLLFEKTNPEKTSQSKLVKDYN